MKFVAHEDVEAPIDFVFEQMSDFPALERSALRRGAEVQRVDTVPDKTPGMAWDVAFVRGILCNWLVCMAVYMASGCSSMIGKMTAVWFPISSFIALGLDHSVANMFIIPLAMFRGADITVGQMFTKNLIPVTLGNIVGGALCVMAPFGLTFGNWYKKKDD